MVRAQVWTFPTEMAATPLVSPITSTGVVLKLLGPLVPSPSSPEPLRPQHLTPPTVVRAQVWRFPAETLATPLVNATTSTGVVLKLGPPVPSSSWKLSLRPQHLTPPPARSGRRCGSIPWRRRWRPRDRQRWTCHPGPCPPALVAAPGPARGPRAAGPERPGTVSGVGTALTSAFISSVESSSSWGAPPPN